MSTWTVLRWHFAWWELAVFPLICALPACGPRWTSADARNATDSARLGQQMEIACGREDGGDTCRPALVRALERASYCAVGSMLARHGEAVPDAGDRVRAGGYTVTFDDAVTTCATLTGMSRAEWADFLSLRPDAQAAAAEAYRGQDWARSPDTLGAVLRALETAGAVAGALSGINSAIVALRNL